MMASHPCLKAHPYGSCGELSPVLECCLWGLGRDETLCATFLSAGPIQTASAFLEPCSYAQGIIKQSKKQTTTQAASLI